MTPVTLFWQILDKICFAWNELTIASHISGFTFDVISLCFNFFHLLAPKPNLETNSFIIFTRPNPVLLVPGFGQVGYAKTVIFLWEIHSLKINHLTYCEITFIRGVPIFVVFVGRLIHEIKNPTNNETWEAVWHRYIAMLSSSDLDFLNQLHRVQLTILITK